MIYTEIVMKGEMYMNMKMKKIAKEGFFLFLLYSLFTLCLFMSADRIERLDQVGDDFRNTNQSVSINFLK